MNQQRASDALLNRQNNHQMNRQITTEELTDEQPKGERHPFEPTEPENKHDEPQNGGSKVNKDLKLNTSFKDLKFNKNDLKNNFEDLKSNFNNLKSNFNNLKLNKDQQIIDKLLKTRHIKPITANNYLKNIKFIYKTIFNENEIHDLNNLKRFKKITDFIKYKIHNLNTKKNYINSIIIVLGAFKFPSYVISKYSGYNTVLRVKINKSKNGGNFITSREKENLITKSELENLLEVSKGLYESAIKNKNPENYQKTHIQNYLLLLLYCDEIPPIRNNFINTIIKDEIEDISKLSDKHNYIDMNSNIFYLKNYKTYKSYGLITVNLPVKVVDVIKKWNDITKSKYLLVLPKTNIPMNSNNLTKAINRLFKPLNKKIGTTILRKSFITNKYPKNKSTQEEKQKDARIMGHSLDTQDVFYNKNGI